uniref:Uncharacterized protein n=1 Tax=Avena sativa TaxID=4498 RepID=A0ACD5ZAX9_AVESA
MEDGSSDFSDWEVLSAASAAGGDEEEDVVLVSGQGGDVLYDHFALDPSSPAAEASWSEPASDDEEVQSEIKSVHRFDSISPEPADLTAVADSTAQLQLGGADVTAQGSLLGASFASHGATWTAHDEQITEALGAAEIHAARGSGQPDSDSIPAHQAMDGILGSDATPADGVSLQTENSILRLEDSTTAQLEDGAADATTESSALEAAAAATSDEVHTAPEEPEQGQDAGATSGCGESDGDEKDCSSPVVAAAAPVAGEGGEGKVLVWWRLPFRLIHYCAWKVKPVWSISIAAAFLGIVVLGRRMYRMRRKTTGLPQIKIAFDDKRASQFADRAARLNEAFLIAKRVPALRTSSGAALPWSMMQER